MPSPVLVSSPSAQNIVQLVNCPDGSLFDGKDGKIFIDGSCSNPNSKTLARAGFGVCQINEEGAITKGMFGVVPRMFPQTSLAGEVAGLGYAACSAMEGEAVTDCAEVLRCWERGLLESAKRYGPHADTFKSLLLALPEPDSNLTCVSKTKAHRVERLVCDSEMYEFLGNERADELAKKGAALHAAEECDISSLKSAEKEVRLVAAHVAQVLSDAKWFEESKPKRLAQGDRLRFPRTRGMHEFMWYNGTWTCCKCHLRIRQSSSQSKFSSVCLGSSALGVMLNAETGHKLKCALIEGGGVLYFCAVCFAFAESVPRKLAKACTFVMGPFGPTAKSRIRTEKALKHDCNGPV